MYTGIVYTQYSTPVRIMQEGLVGTQHAASHHHLPGFAGACALHPQQAGAAPCTPAGAIS
jgi:MOSC domain-containing protein YiiM